MRYEDRISVTTPEGVELDLTLAGLGSRFVAGVIDAVIQAAVLIALFVLAGLLSAGTGALGLDEEVDGGLAVGIAIAVMVTASFLVLIGYHVAFETWAGGRSPGKRWTGLRVVRSGGGPVSFLTSVVRNLVRLVDFLPTVYGVGIVAILASPRNQRLGDLAAGTIVVHEAPARRPAARAEAAHEPAAGSPDTSVALPASGWDVSGITADELATVRRFLERRPQLTPEARQRLGMELAARLRTKVTGPPDELHPETFLVEVAAAKAARG